MRIRARENLTTQIIRGIGTHSGNIHVAALSAVARLNSSSTPLDIAVAPKGNPEPAGFGTRRGAEQSNQRIRRRWCNGLLPFNPRDNPERNLGLAFLLSLNVPDGHFDPRVMLIK